MARKDPLGTLVKVAGGAHLMIAQAAAEAAGQVAVQVAGQIPIIGNAIVSLYCTKISFSVMDIINGIGTFLSWMMKPIEDAMNALFAALAIDLPSLPGMPWFNLGLPDLGFDFLFDWDLDFPIPYAYCEGCRRLCVVSRQALERTLCLPATGSTLMASPTTLEISLLMSRRFRRRRRMRFAASQSRPLRLQTRVCPHPQVR